MIYVLIPLYIIICVFLILVVLLQQGKGADVASAFGASSTQSTFGARGATSLLEKITTWSFVAFSVLAIVISLIQSRGPKSVLSGAAPVAAKPATVPAAPATGAPAPATAASVPVTAAPAPATAAPTTSAPAPAVPSTAPQTN